MALLAGAAGRQRGRPRGRDTSAWQLGGGSTRRDSAVREVEQRGPTELDRSLWLSWKYMPGVRVAKRQFDTSDMAVLQPVVSSIGSYGIGVPEIISVGDSVSDYIVASENAIRFYAVLRQTPK